MPDVVPPKAMLKIKKATSPSELREIQLLYDTYSDWCRKKFVEEGLTEPDSPELNNFNKTIIPGSYISDRHAILLATWNDQPAGCAFLRPHDESRAEMKRLYVHPIFRKKKIGRALMEAIMKNAWKMGFRYLIICSHDFMKSAIHMYQQYGFYDIPEFCPDKLQSGNVHMEFDLAKNFAVKIIERQPTVGEYQKIRGTTNWTTVSNQQVDRALKKSLFNVCAVQDNQVVGIGRIIGDGGLYYYIQDVIVLPEFRGLGIGKKNNGPSGRIP